MSWQETVTARYRGLMISSFQIWTSVGTLVGTVVDNFTAPIPGRNSYLIPLGIIYAVPVLLSIGLFFIPESPRWLMQHDKPEKAMHSLLWLRPHGEAAVRRELADIQEALEGERAMAEHTSVLDMFTNPIDRRRTWLAVGAISTQGASGAMYMIGKLTALCSPSRGLRYGLLVLKSGSLWNILLQHGQHRSTL